MAINQNPRVEPEWVSLREAAKIYAISTYTLRRRIASGDLPAVKLGYKLIRVRISDLNRLSRQSRRPGWRTDTAAGELLGGHPLPCILTGP